MAPDIRDLKALASVLKMHSAFESVAKLAADWIERGKRELKPQDMESGDKRDWYELSDRWDNAVNNLKQKVSSFEKEYGVSPILAYIPQPNGSTVGWRIFLGYDSRRVYPSSVQARGFRMLQFNDLPVWFEELRGQQPEIFRSENLTEDEVYDLSPPAERLKPEELFVLRDEFLKDLVEARVPAYTQRAEEPGERITAEYGEVKIAKKEFIDRFNKVVNKRLNYNENIRLLEPLVEQIKREHSLAIPVRPGRLAVGPPISPFTAVVSVRVPETGRRLEDWYLMYVPHMNKYQLNYQYRSAWDIQDFKTLDDARVFLAQGKGRLYLHAYRMEEDAVWSYPLDITPFKLSLDKHWENYEADGRHLYHLQQPTWNGIQWIWRLTHVYQFGNIMRQDDVEAAESELLNNKYGFVNPNKKPTAEPIKTVSIPLYTTAHVESKPKFKLGETVYYKWDEKQKGKIIDNLNAPFVKVLFEGNITPSDTVESQLLSQQEFSALETATPKAPAGKPLTEDDVLFGMPYKGDEPESLDSIRKRLTHDDFDLLMLPQILASLLKSGDIIEPYPGAYTWSEENTEENVEVEREELADVILENEGLVKTFEKNLAETVAPPTKLTHTVPVQKPTAPISPITKPKRSLSYDDMRLLQDYWNNEFFRALGRVPSGVSSTFRVNFEQVKEKSFDEAKEALLAAAGDIISEFGARETVKKAVPIREPVQRVPKVPTRIPLRREEEPGEEEGAGGPMVPGGRVPPAQFPSFSLDVNMPFPRGPTSRERIRIWRAFLYEMQQQGYDGSDYQRQFDDYIAGTQFLSWEDMRDKYKVFVKTVMAGQELPPLFTWRGTPIPTGLKGTIQEGTELEKLQDLIIHYSSVAIRNARSVGEVATLEDLKNELAERGIIPLETDLGELRSAAKTALDKAAERKDLWLSGITATEINDFLAS